jgi:hypothetical protein
MSFYLVLLFVRHEMNNLLSIVFYEIQHREDLLVHCNIMLSCFLNNRLLSVCSANLFDTLKLFVYLFFSLSLSRSLARWFVRQSFHLSWWANQLSRWKRKHMRVEQTKQLSCLFFTLSFFPLMMIIIEYHVGSDNREWKPEKNVDNDLLFWKLTFCSLKRIETFFTVVDFLFNFVIRRTLDVLQRTRKLELWLCLIVDRRTMSPFKFVPFEIIRSIENRLQTIRHCVRFQLWTIVYVELVENTEE